ncbi:histone-lysine N-methyltransferase 2A-like, partial [Ruditapes philippinarum]|uniref:histone-lysine N-methyltransferase 2A-like n=1 Tax=Ruditapes philippinarum TaxID=129788 RepID=UPI00295B1199
MTELFVEEKREVKKAVTIEEPVYVDVETCSPAVKKVEEICSPTVKKSVRKGTPVQSPIHVSETPTLSISPPPLPPTLDETPTKEQELSPLKAGEGSEKRQRKKRAFKELLRNKQDKVEEEEPVQQEKPVIQEPIPVVATGSVEISPRGGPGPRIKHVCRNAAVVLGQPLATFPEKSELRLSALPTKDKVQLWKKDEESKAANDESDDDRPMEEIIQQSGDSVVIMKKSPARGKISKKLTGAGGLHLYKRKMRCRQCPGCVRQDCGICRHCLDKPKFGGQGVLKQGCVERRCSKPLIKRSATEAFIDEKKKDVTVPRVERTRAVSESDGQEGQSDFAPSDNLEPVIPGSEVTQTVFGLETQTGTLLEDETQSNNNVSEKPNENIPAEKEAKPLPEQTSSQKYDLEKQRIVTRGQSTTTRSHSSEVRKLTFEDIPNFQLERISSRNKESGKISSKLMKKMEMQEKYSKKEGGNDGQCYPVTLQSVLPASRQWGSLLSQPKYYPIKVDFKGKCDLGSAWNYGMALTISNAMSVRALCFLCGSAGKHEMIYCNICCEPFHEFCLEDWEQPTPDHFDDWICAACQFCHVCGRQNNLLQCDKCQNTYHPGCLGPNYPTKPSKRKNIWICTKCVKCKSCGATTPGSDSQATWTYDFSLCFECGRLMDKGNFCPICRKCYSDDDWESKMIQCNMCESWVHSKCEGLTDEMYEILSYLPEDLSFYCRKCFPVGCPEWESTLKRELRLGLENILQSLILSKSSQYILKQEKKSPPKQQALPSHQTPEKQKKSYTLNNTRNTEATQERVKRNMKSFEKIKQLLNCGNSKGLTNGIVEDSNIDNLELNSEDSCENGLQTDNKLKQACVNEFGNTINDTNSRENHVAMETNDNSGDNSLSQTNNIVGDTSDVAEHVINTVNNEITKQSCDNNDDNDPNKGVPPNEGCPVTKGCPVSKDCATSKIVENKGMVEDRTIICDKQTVSDYVNKVQGCDDESEINRKTTEEIHCDNTNSDNALTSGSSELPQNEIIRSERIDDEVKNERTEGSEGVVTHSEGKGTQCSITHQKLNTDLNVQVVNVGISGVDTKKSDLETQAAENKGEVVQRRNTRVHFSVDESKNEHVVGEIKETENNFPKDLMEIAQKMKTGDYKSVAIFCEDILRVIQTYLDNEEEARTSRKKATQSAKSIFAKQLEKVFPWFNVKTCRHWYSMRSLPDGMLADATLPPNNDHTYAQWLERIEVPRSPQPSPFKRRTATPVKKYMPIDEEDYEPGQMYDGDDERKCMFCQTFGDQEANDAGRLLYCGQDDWCHINCALWSAEVYEDADGELKNIVEAFSRGKMLRCDLCDKAGATVGCNTKGCKSNYHFMCARKDQCRFQEDKKVFCKQHRMYIDAELLTGDRFNVLRRAHVGTLFVRSVKKRWSKGLHCGDVSVLMGSCCVENLGRLTDLSDSPKFLQPVDFITTRMYWSTKDARRRCVYTCRIVEVRPEALKSPTITIKDMRIVHDQNHPDFIPLSNLDLTGINSVSEQENLSILGTDSENPLVDLTSETADITANTADITADSADITSYTAHTVSESAEERTMEISYNKSELSLNQKTDANCCKRKDEITKRRASFSGRPSDNAVIKGSDKLSMSWPIGSMKSCNENLKQANLSFLSPNTLKMLNIKDPSKYIKPVQNNENTKEDEEEFSLLKVANRLNRAAAKSSRRNSEERRSEGNSPLPLRSNSRSPSVERGCSPMPTRTFSPIVGLRQRSQSVDRFPEIKPSLNLHTKFSSMLESLPEKPFSPPSRMLSRSKSLSVEKETLLFKPSSNTSCISSNEPFLPAGNDESPQCSRRGRSVSDPLENMPEPISFSSPLVRTTDMVQKKFDLSNLSTGSEGSKKLESSLFSITTSLETESSVTGSTNTEDNVPREIAETDTETSDMITENEVIDISQNIDTDEETTETIVVMTESGESLSEEDAIKIVKDMIEQRNSSLQTEYVDPNTVTEDDNNPEPESNHVHPHENQSEQNGCTENKRDESGIVKEDNSDSPFIPQIENESVVNKRVRRNTNDKKVDNTEEKNDSEENRLQCNDDNDILDITDKVECDSNDGKQLARKNCEQLEAVTLDIV